MINVAFIIYKRSEINYNSLMENLRALSLPENYKVEYITVTGNGGYGQAYNAGMRKSKAKYKIYVNENAHIIDPNWIVMAINVFAKSPNIAMIGASGSQTIALDGVYVRNSKRVGCIKIENSVVNYSQCPVGGYESVLAVDSFLFLTQYDMVLDETYREEFFIGAIKSFDFRRRRLLSVVIGCVDAPVQYVDKEIYVNEIEGERFEQEYLRNIINIELRRCACCGSVIEDYMPLPLYYTLESIKRGGLYHESEMVNSRHYTCPMCYASDRERAYAFWMRRKFNQNTKMRILDVAPSRSLSSFIKREFPRADYKSADLFMEGVDYKLDVMDMSAIKTNSIDFFVCSHVLEHVKDDVKAMAEFKRILNPAGCGIMVVPIDLDLTEIDEDPYCEDIDERWRRFGQDDHVRRYSRNGFISRLKSVGFRVEEYGKDFFGYEGMFENALKYTSVVYIVS